MSSFRDTPPEVHHTASAAETRDLGEALAQRLEGGATLLLEGDLGAGKTVLVQGLAQGLGIDARQVQSPTFTLIQEHPPAVAGGLGLVHVDLYRLEPAETETLGLDEIFADGGTVKAVEWASRLAWRPPGALVVLLEREDHQRRRIRVGYDLRLDGLTPSP